MVNFVTDKYFLHQSVQNIAPTATGSFPDKLLSQVIDAIDYITKIGNSSHAPIVISRFCHGTSVQDSSSSHRRR